MINFVNILRNIFVINNNKCRIQSQDIEPGHDKLETISKNAPNSVIKLVKKFSDEDKICKESNIICPDVLAKENDLYIRFENYILHNSVGENLPRTIDIQKYLKIGERQRKYLNKIAVNKGLLKKHKSRFILNLNYEV